MADGESRGTPRGTITTDEAASLLDLVPRQVQRMAKAGDLGATRTPTKAERRRFGLRAHTLLLRASEVDAEAERRSAAAIRKHNAQALRGR